MKYPFNTNEAKIIIPITTFLKSFIKLQTLKYILSPNINIIKSKLLFCFHVLIHENKEILIDNLSNFPEAVLVIMKIKNLETKLFWALVAFGVLSRLFLVVKLPIWHDEYYSIWAATHSAWDIITSKTDLVHPPGYYLILHFWGLISHHLYWYRFLSVIAFTANIFLIKKLAENLGKQGNSNLLVFLYIFSGYFLTFDWQVRMYTLIVTLILFSVFTLSKLVNIRESKTSLWIYFTLMNYSGLYIDYAYVFYFVPMAVFTLIYIFLKKRDEFFVAFDSFAVSSILFAVTYPTIFLGGLTGVHGIEWMRPFIRADFFIPFFLGSHIAIVFSLIFLLVFIYGTYIFVKKKNYNFGVLAITFSALFSLVFTLVYSYYKTPLFHVRSLQIVGIAIIIFLYFGLSALSKVFKPYLFTTLILCFIFNFIVVNQTLFRSPGSLVIDYFPWRDILNSTDLTGVKTVKYKIVYKLPTPMLLYGLEYTLAGRENIGRQSIKMSEYIETEDNSNCEKFNDNLLDLYKCK